MCFLTMGLKMKIPRSQCNFILYNRDFKSKESLHLRAQVNQGVHDQILGALSISPFLMIRKSFVLFPDKTIYLSLSLFNYH